MRSFLLLSLVGLVAGVTPVEKATCAVDSGEAVSDATDAAMFVWAASKRCGKVGMDVKCEIDASASVKSVNSMINVILKAVNKCDGLHTANKACALKASGLTEHTAALSAAAGMAYQKCPSLFGQKPAAAAMGAIAAPVMCTVDIKNTAKHLFHVTKLLTKTTQKCEDNTSKDCTVNALDVSGSFAGMGSWLAGAVGHCKRTTALAGAGAAKADTRVSLCAQAATALIEQTLKVAQDGVELSELCGAEPAPAPAPANQAVIVREVQVPRLFELFGGKSGDNTSMNLVLGAFLPVTAIVSFVGGRYYASRGAQIRDVMSDHE